MNGWESLVEPVLTVGLTLVRGAAGSPEALGYTLYYATSFLFAGLAVALAFQGGLFNIGGEGQAMLGGLGVALAAFLAEGWPWPVAAGLAALGGAGLGALWGLGPGWLRARRGSHEVITTIMFNFLASALLTWLLVERLAGPGSQAPETRSFDETVWLPGLKGLVGWFGLDFGYAPVNLSLLLALGCAFGLHGLLGHTRFGHELRVVGAGGRAALYAGVRTGRVLIVAMALSGALAGLVGLNEILGTHHRLLLGFTNGCGFVGIAVALLAGNRPLRLIPAALLFGALVQGGSELAFAFPGLPREVVAVCQALVVLACAALPGRSRARPADD
jgi:simple sugar transport system permease protein